MNIPNQQLTTQGSFGPHMNPQQQQMELERVPNEDASLAEIDCPLIGGKKPHIHWTEELHRRFVGAVNELGGVFCKSLNYPYIFIQYTPKQIHICFRSMFVIHLIRSL